jgi:hypothetical protein
MLKRKIYDRLIEFKRERANGTLNKCLFVKGARQVGKSYIIRQFGRKEYASYIEINFIQDKTLKDIFSNNLSAESILKNITAQIKDAKIISGNTLIFLDEIQTCGNARTALKFLAEEKQIDVIASGSLLGLAYWQDGDGDVEEPDSIPVGYEDVVTMYSLDFEEFLWAYGYGEDAISYLRTLYQSGEAITGSLHEHYENLFREFMVVGGMPEVVADFVKNKDFNRVDRIQNRILSDYKDDISKHAKGVEKAKVRACYDAVGMQLCKPLKKFQFSTVEKGQTRRKYGDSVQWLVDSALVNICYRITEPYVPLSANADRDYYKLYINDTGLLCAMYGYDVKLAILRNTIKGNAKGGIYENVISECLIKRGYKLYCFRPNDNKEIEFLIEKNGEVVPVEVKAANSKAISLDSYIKEFEPTIAYKLVGTGNGVAGVKRTIPHYMVMFL